ncbi:GIY-YIG nuclease family protein [Melioribacter sp. Ez-97]|uniref:GIY-YIG nuclease family protein n=1 Tax=Melioribacter sp. Ez-97 TaxID=3423434 RepID=UPI003EDB2DEE
MYYVYAISSLKRNYIYVGITNNPQRRLAEHNRGKNRTTAPYRPFEMIYLEKCENRPRAREREKYFKSGSGKEYLKKIAQTPCRPTLQ